jgi:hypothetical protein
MSRFFTAALLAAGAVLAGCATPGVPPKDFTAFNTVKPRSILVVPVINHSNETEAADLFLTTLPVMLAERGYYVFPVSAVKKLVENDGLSDPALVHGAATPRLAGLFGAETVLYVEVLEWRSVYTGLSAGTAVKFLYTLKDGRTNALLWQDERAITHAQQASSGNILADLIATAIVAAINSTKSDYTPVALMANEVALGTAGQGVPFGPYSSMVAQNAKLFPSTGTGTSTNATLSALSWPVEGKPRAARQAAETPKASAVK